LQKERTLTQPSFQRLLEWLDDGVESNGERYLEMRRRLVAYFDRRNRLSPDELADETLTRVAHTLEESGAIAITPPARYCYVVARFVFLEDLRRRQHGPVSLETLPGAEPLAFRATAPANPDRADETRERRLDCLERCLDSLDPAQRALIVDYYREARREKIEQRREMAKHMGVTMNALSIRACRIRAQLEACVNACCKSR
jgi:DNA-directed RNA polymerase specialized sigma24 family protein